MGAAGTYGHGVPIAILVFATGLAPDGALAACTTTAGVRLQANAASTCTATGSYTGVGVASGRGAVSSLTGGVINAAAALTMNLAQNSVFGASAAGAGSQVNLQAGATISRAGTTTGNGGSVPVLAAPSPSTGRCRSPCPTGRATMAC